LSASLSVTYSLVPSVLSVVRGGTESGVVEARVAVVLSSAPVAASMAATRPTVSVTASRLPSLLRVIAAGTPARLWVATTALVVVLMTLILPSAALT
jgi:hypothetical protein